MKSMLLATTLLMLATFEVRADGREPQARVDRSLAVPTYRHAVPSRRHAAYAWCRPNIARLTRFEGRAMADGRVSRDEARIAGALSADLATVCGYGSWSPLRMRHPR